jgi:hypothetical protein
MDNKFPPLSKLQKQEKRKLVDNCVKYHIITTTLDYLVTSKLLWDKDAVSYITVREWLNKRATYDYMWTVPDAQIDLWLHEMIWLELVSFNQDKQEFTLKEHGYSVYKNQQYHSIYASLLEAKYSRKIAQKSMIASILAFIISAVTISLTLIGCIK